jgi:NADH-quinone oxidoreductase subunit G
LSADKSESASVGFTIDGREITVPKGTLVIRAAESLGIYIPRFCDHPYLAPLGACRQCLVEVEGQRKPLTACTTTATDGMVVKTQFTSEVAQDGQEGQLEFLLINHPLDCPQCDKGGECPLQDQTLVYGPGLSRFVDRKRRYPKPVPISPLVLLDRERCVLCARCTRFAGEISADPFIELFERSALEQVAIFEDEPYRSVYSGNVVQICPVGALTSAQFRFKARPFDLSSVESVCNRCASGCNVTVQERRGEVVRVLARDNAEVNDLWNCDKGRYGWAYTAHPDRVTAPLVRKADEFVETSWAEAIAFAAERLDRARNGGGVAVLTGGRLPDEDAYALSRFARTALRTNDVDSRMRATTAEENEVIAELLAAGGATYQDVDRASVVVWAGGDLREESPILFLRVHKAAKRGAAIVEIGPRRTALRKVGARWLACAAATEAGVLAALAVDTTNDLALLDPSRAEPDVVRGIRDLIGRAGSDVVVLASENLARSPGAPAAAWNLSVGTGGRFGWVPRRASARGELWAGLHPHLLPGGRRVDDEGARGEVESLWKMGLPTAPGRDARAILGAAESLGALYLAGVDVVGDFPDASLGGRAIEAAPFVVAHDHFLTETTRRADVILPASAIAERPGTYTDWEGRAQSFRAAIDPAGLSESDWEITARLAEALDVAFPASLDALRREMHGLRREPREPRRVTSQQGAQRRADEHRPFTLIVQPMLIDAGTMMIGTEPLTRTGDGSYVELAVPDAVEHGITSGDLVRVSSACGEVMAQARVSEDLVRFTVVVPANADGFRASALLDAGEPVTLVRVEKA